jgi:hypothetical protein
MKSFIFHFAKEMLIDFGNEKCQSLEITRAFKKIRDIFYLLEPKIFLKAFANDSKSFKYLTF